MQELAGFEQAEAAVRAAVEWLRLAIESVGALVIAAGIVVAVGMLLRAVLRRRNLDFDRVRLTLARHLALALELQLAADILSTAIAPSWDRIGKLAAIAIIRTALNYFLMLEMRNETAKVAQAGQASPASPPPVPPASGPPGLTEAPGRQPDGAPGAVSPGRPSRARRRSPRRAAPAVPGSRRPGPAPPGG